VFFHFLNVSALNSYVVYKMNACEKIQRMAFQKNLGKELLMVNIVRRMRNCDMAFNYFCISFAYLVPFQLNIYFCM